MFLLVCSKKKLIGKPIFLFMFGKLFCCTNDPLLIQLPCPLHEYSVGIKNLYVSKQWQQTMKFKMKTMQMKFNLDFNNYSTFFCNIHKKLKFQRWIYLRTTTQGGLLNTNIFTQIVLKSSYTHLSPFLGCPWTILCLFWCLINDILRRCRCTPLVFETHLKLGN